MTTEEQPYTPSTEAVREVYYSAPGVQGWEAARAAAFDRWLVQHDAEVRRASRLRKVPCAHDSGNKTARGYPIICDRTQGHIGRHSYSGRVFWG